MKKNIKIQKWLTQLSVTSFGSHKLRPLWQSVLCDYICIMSFGIYKP